MQGACEEVLLNCRHMQLGDSVTPLCGKGVADILAKCEDMGKEVWFCHALILCFCSVDSHRNICKSTACMRGSELETPEAVMRFRVIGS